MANGTRLDIIRDVSGRLSQDYGFACTLDNISLALGFKGNVSSRSGNFAYASLAWKLYQEGVHDHTDRIDYAVRKLEKRRDPSLYKRMAYHQRDLATIETVTAELIRRGVGKTPYEICVATGHEELTKYEGQILELVIGEKRRYIREETVQDDHHDPEDDAEKLARIKVIQHLYMTAVLNR